MNRILIVGAYGGFNLGDDVIMQQSVELVRERFPNATIAIRGSHQRYIPRLVSGVAIDDCPRREKYSLTVYGGGTQLFSFHPSRRRAGLAKATALFWRLGNLVSAPRRIPGALRRRTRGAGGEMSPTIALGVGFGPFIEADEAETRIRGFLGPRNLFCWTRDPTSAEHARNAGYATLLGGDLASLGLTVRLGGFPASLRSSRTKPKIGFILRDWPFATGDGLGLSVVREAVAWLQRIGCSVCFLSFSRIDDRLWNKMLGREGWPVSVWDPEKMEPETFLRLLGRCDCIVSARYHGALFAAALAVPTIGIDLDPKIRGLCSDFGDWALHWSRPWDVRTLTALIETCLAERDSINVALGDAVSRVESLSRAAKGEFMSQDWDDAWVEGRTLER